VIPTGTVTFLFTDVEGSTRLWQRHPEAMKGALARHHALVQGAIEANGGYVFQIVGDAFCASFHTVSAGVAAAVAAQRALIAEPWDEPGPIRVRIAVHTGAADFQAGAYKSGEYGSGLTLSHASRLLSTAHGGQILVSGAAREMLRDAALQEIELRDLGRHRLRDLASSEHVFQVVASDLPSVFPSLASREAIPHNLPRPLTSFVGREREIADVKRQLGKARLLTLTGPGGTGKTRLSVQIATDLLADFPDGVWLVELAAIADPALASQALAMILGVREEAGRPLLATLADHLRSRRALLLFDNCEHLIDACARLADDILRACSEVRIVASSREPLGLTGEVVYRVPPLSLPDPRTRPTIERLEEYEAIRLFVDRATAVKPDFALTDETVGPVAQISRRLDGIPLAIELAAARVRTLSVRQIAENLDERFRLLTGGSRAALPRHQTLRGLIDWSYGLLTDTERALFRRLSAFVGGWTLEAVCAVGAGGGVDRHDIIDLVGRLVDKSLVLMDDQGSEGRYRLLETIRQYALEKLAETGDGDTVRARHREFYLDFAETAAQRLHGPEQVVWLARLEADHDNLRAALRWSLERGEAELGLRLGSALWLFWDTRGYFREGREWLDDLLALAHVAVAPMPPVARRALANVLDGAARMRGRFSEFSQAIEFHRRGLAVWRELHDKRGIAESLNNLGDVMHQCGDRAGAKPLIEESLALFQELSDKRGTAHALINLAAVFGDEGDTNRARALYEESVPLFEAIEDWRGLAHSLDNLGGILSRQGDFARAAILYDRSLQLAEEIGDKHAIATALRSLGSVAAHRQDHARARSLYEDSIARFRELNDEFCVAKSLIGSAVAAHTAGDHERAVALGDQGLGLLRGTDAKGYLALCLDELARVALASGNIGRSARCYHEALALWAEAQDAAGIAMGLEGAARVAEARGRTPGAQRLLAAAAAWRKARGLPLSGAAVDALDICARPLGQAATWSGSSTMTFEQALAHAREQITDLLERT
jgi:predicted ATPase/class 3 adenylate cyclase